MRQVPEYGIIGEGKMARHFARYLQYLNLSFLSWSRREYAQAPLSAHFLQCKRFVLLIKDDAIEPFLTLHPELQKANTLHFSGSLVTPELMSAHPLMTFGPTLYAEEVYRGMPFIIEKDGMDFSTLLPGLPNKAFKIDKRLKPLYHAYCVMSNNFSTLLWEKFFSILEDKFQIPRHAAYPYLQRTLHNIEHGGKLSLTGPLVRKDKTTIEKNLSALKEDSFQNIYQAFVKAYEEENENT